MYWKGPYQIKELMVDNDLIPPKKGVYVISLKKWASKPTRDCDPRYDGSTEAKKGLHIRLARLMLCATGNFNPERRVHSGGKTIWAFCNGRSEKYPGITFDPNDLWIGWAEYDGCVRCKEAELYDALGGGVLLNKKKPRCKKHKKP